ncbi:MAG: hypothetical protein KAX58_07525, partial [Aeromonadaceae bacterium]|nr:hypothetical protein [Aeromonadaceae bacterium]
LKELGVRANQAWRAGQTFKQQDEKLLREQTAFIDDESMYITKSVQYRHLLAEMLQANQEDRRSELMSAWENIEPSTPEDEKQEAQPRPFFASQIQDTPTRGEKK